MGIDSTGKFDMRSKYKNTKHTIHYTRTTSINRVFIKLFVHTLNFESRYPFSHFGSAVGTCRKKAPAASAFVRPNFYRVYLIVCG